MNEPDREESRLLVWVAAAYIGSKVLPARVARLFAASIAAESTPTPSIAAGEGVATGTTHPGPRGVNGSA